MATNMYANKMIAKDGLGLKNYSKHTHIMCIANKHRAIVVRTRYACL